MDWRKLISFDDIGDIIALAAGARKMLARRGREFERRVEHDVRDSHILDDVTTFAGTFGRLFARKRREFAKTSQKAAEQVRHEAREGRERVEAAAADLRDRVDQKTHEAAKQVKRDVREGRERVEAAATDIRDRVDQKTYEAAKQIVESHEERHPQDNGEVGLFLVGAILGTLIGAVAAMWYAPQSGEQTRHEIEQAVDEARQRVEGESLNDAIREGKAEARRYQETTGFR